MKKLFILAFASVIGGGAIAQTTPAATGGIKYGLKAGVNLPKYQFQNEGGTDPETKTTTNFHVTGYLDAPIASMFSIQPALSLQGKGGEFFDNGLSGGNKVENKQNTLWIEVPVNLVAHIPVAAGTNFFVGAGPYGAFGIAGQNKQTIGNTVTTSDISFGSDNGNSLKSLDFGLNFLAGVQLNSGFNVGAGYGLGLADLRPTGNGGNGKQTNRVLSFSVGFGL